MLTMAWTTGETGMLTRRTTQETRLCTDQVRLCGPTPYARHSDSNKLPTAKTKQSKNKPKVQAKNKPAPAATTSLSAYRPAVSDEQENAFMSGLLGDWDVPSSLAASKDRSRKRKPTPDYRYDDRSSSPGPSASRGKAHTRRGNYGHRETYADTSSDGFPSDGFEIGNGASSDDGLVTSPKKKVRTEAKGIAPTIEKMGAMGVAGPADADEDEFYDAFDDIPIHDLMETDEKPILISKAEPPSEKVPKLEASSAATKNEENTSWLSVYDSLTVKADETFGKLDSGATVSSSSTHASTISALQEDGSFRFFWLDYLEHEGVLYFIGKTLDKNSNSYVSCCVTVTNLQRNLFVLPRPFQLDNDGFETDIVPDMQAVWRDFDQVRKKAGIKGWKAKFVKRKYAFGEPGVPREETQWLKVVYGFEGKEIASFF
jgi:DNA polymerase alpha subunit A